MNVEVPLHVLQPAQLGPFVVIRVVDRLPVLGHEVGKGAVGHLRVGLPAKDEWFRMERVRGEMQFFPPFDTLHLVSLNMCNILPCNFSSGV